MIIYDNQARLTQLMPLLVLAALLVASCSISCAQTGNGYPLTPYSGAAAQAPVAVIIATPSTADGSLDVVFNASGSSDDGTVVKYDWDFENDGTYDLLDGGPTPDYTYAAAGTYQATVQVTDNDGQTDTATTGTFTVPVPNTPPTASGSGTQSTETPLQVDYTAVASTDSDGTIALYEWDWDNDGTYDENSTEATASHAFTEFIEYIVKLQVTDNDGDTDAAEITVTLVDSGSGGDGPVAALEADPESGAAPLTVNFDASDSTTPNTEIVKYEWDWSTDGDYDSDTTEPTSSHTFNTVGDYVITVRITDDQDETATAAVDVSVTAASSGLTAVLTVTPLSGAPPLEVSFDATGSSSTDGTITSYEWDFDGNGLFNEAGTTEESFTDNSGPFTVEYITDAVIEVKVRIKDDASNEDIASQTITIGEVLSTITAIVTLSDIDDWTITSTTLVRLYVGDPEDGGSGEDQITADHTAAGDGNPVNVVFADLSAGSEYYIRVQNIIAHWEGDPVPTGDEGMIKDYGPIEVPIDHIEFINATQWREPPPPSS